MPRKNDSELTMSKILEISSKLFFEKGFEQTSIQDIVNELGMSKGAIFHHFKSKDEIFDAVLEHYANIVIKKTDEWLENCHGMTAKDKITYLLECHIADDTLSVEATAAYRQICSPGILAAVTKLCINKYAPLFSRLFIEGINDGSIQTDFPDEAAEMFHLLYNIWATYDDRMCKKMKFLQRTMQLLGVDIISDAVINKYVDYIEREKQMLK